MAVKLTGFKEVHFVFDFSGETLDTCVLKLENEEKMSDKIISSYGTFLPN